MGIFEIISAIVLILACVFIIIVVLMQDTKTQMSQTISGSSNDNFFQRNSGRTKEAMLNKATVAAAIAFFVLALLVNMINLYFGGSDNSSNPGSSGSGTDLDSILSEYYETDDDVSDITIDAGGDDADVTPDEGGDSAPEEGTGAASE